MKLHKRHCFAKVLDRKDGTYAITVLDKDFQCMTIAPWELVALWYNIGELIGFDREDAKHELERLHRKNDQGELDEPSQKIVGRKNRNKTDAERAALRGLK